MTPQAALPPALPVEADNSWPPLPKSSWPSWQTIDLPKTLCSPNNLIKESCLVPLATPLASVVMLPKSPTCLTSSSGAPWVLENGLKWGPAEVQPFVLSPKAWTWNPLKAFGSQPVISQLIVVGSDSELCSKLTTPVTLESPLITATKYVSISYSEQIKLLFFRLSNHWSNEYYLINYNLIQLIKYLTQLIKYLNQLTLFYWNFNHFTYQLWPF